MIRIKVQYDTTTNTFKLVNADFDTLAEGDGLYDLNLPVMRDEVEVAEDAQA